MAQHLNNHLHNHKTHLIFFISIVLALLAITTSVVLAQAPQDISFPIAELGSCESRDACHDYCEEPEHVKECIAFARTHGLMDEVQARKAERVAERGFENGPGGCSSPSECRAYCEDVNHIDECIAFAEREGFADEEDIQEARKIREALRKGARLPGECSTKEQCEAYCQNPNNIEECFAFAQAAGFVEDEEIEHARRALELMKRGETPGQCSSRQECEAYCQNPDHIQECVAFGEKMGFIKPEEAEVMRKTGGRGPGGCRGRGECEAFCNNPENREQCFAFAREHGLIHEEELENIQKHTERLQETLEEAPAEVRTCLREQLGENIIEDIRSGNLTPGPRIGERMRQCFDNLHTQQFEADTSRMPAGVRQCLENRLGADFLSKMRGGEGEPGTDEKFEETIESCFQEFGGEEPHEKPQEGHRPEGDFERGFNPENLDEAIRQMPPEIRSCVQQRAPQSIEEMRAIAEDCRRAIFEKFEHDRREFEEGVNEGVDRFKEKFEGAREGFEEGFEGTHEGFEEFKEGFDGFERDENFGDEDFQDSSDGSNGERSQRNSLMAQFLKAAGSLFRGLK